MQGVVAGLRSTLLCVAIAGCAHAPWPGSPDATADATTYRVTVVGATIEARRPDGTPWNVTKPDKTWTIIGSALGLAVGQGALGAAVGDWVAGDEKNYPPAPLVELNVGGTKYSTVALEPTLSPAWDQDLLLDLKDTRSTDEVVIIVRDGVTGQVVGTTKRTVDALVSRNAQTLTDIPNVPSLNLRVQPARIERASYVIVVPGRGETTIPVAGGDVLSLEARGQVCVAPDRCFEAAGDQTQESTGLLGRRRYRNAQSNWHHFEGVPHGSLVGILSGTPIYFGASSTYHVPRAGTLQLFVNDAKPDDNTLQFTVVVRSNPCSAAPCADPPGSPNVEAVLQVNKIVKNARREQAEKGEVPQGATGLLPAAACCSSPGKKCPANPAQWAADPIWNSLDSQIVEPSVFQYAYQSDGAAFTVMAVGDPSCTGRTMTYAVHDDQGAQDVRVSFAPAP
jgi:hypothetical protein